VSLLDRKEMLKRLKAKEDSLEISIAKWVELAEGNGEDQADLNCALCETYKNRKRDHSTDCAKCPVCLKIGKRYCDGSPYELYVHVETDFSIDDAEREEKMRTLATKERDFLISLRKPS